MSFDLDIRNMELEKYYQKSSFHVSRSFSMKDYMNNDIFCKIQSIHIYNKYQKTIGTFVLKHFVSKKINITSLKSLNRNMFIFMRFSISLRSN